MSILSGKNILLGVTGGIAAYKSTYLVRLFKKQGANVQVLMTPSSKDFVTPLSLSTLSNNPVLSDFFDPNDENKLWNNHVELALWADIFLIAPIFLTLGHSGSFSYLDAPGNASCGAILSDVVTSVTPIPNSNATLRAHIGTGREQWHSTGGQ